MSTQVIPYDQLERMASSLVKSRMFGLEDVDQALALMAIAQAEGKHPAIIARDFHVIKGRPAKKAEAMMRDLINAGGQVKWNRLDDEVADAVFSHPQGGTVRITWDIARAKQAGLAGNDNWRKYPRAMLRSRCVSEGVRTVCPVATSGVYTPDEVHDMADEPPAMVDVTPAKDLKILTPEDIEAHINAMVAAADLETLKSAYATAYSAAKQAGDIGALEAFERAKDHCKRDLTAEDA